MPGRLEIVDARDRRERSACAYATVQEMLRQGKRVAWIAPSRNIALAVKRHLADAGKGLAGVEIATIDTWAARRWTLYGDGRKPVSSLQRRILVKKVLDEGAWTSAALASAGMVECVAGIVRAGAGLEAFEGGAEQIAEVAELTAAQRELMGACQTYYVLLQERGLIEPGTVIRELARTMPEAGWQHLVLDGCWSLEGSAVELAGAACEHAGVTLVGCLGNNAAFEPEREITARIADAARERRVEVVRAAGEALVEQGDDLLKLHVPARSPELIDLANALFSAEQTEPVAATGALRACMPAGRYAEGALLAQQVGQLVEVDGIAPREIVVVARNPLAKAQAMAGPLSEHAPRGIAVAAEGTDKLARSQAGAFVLAWMRLLEAAQADPDAPAPDLRTLASDLARSPYMRIPLGAALKLDRAWRRKRTTSACEFVADLVGQLEVQENGGVQEAECLPSSLQPTPGDTVPNAHPLAPSCPTSPFPSPDSSRDLAWVLALLNARLPQSLTPDDAFERACAKGIERATQQWHDFMGATPSAETLAWLLDTLSAPNGWVSVPASDIAAQRQARVLQASPNAVRVVTAGEMDAIEARAVIFCDLTADTYPLRERVDVKSALWSALNLPGGPGQVATLRRTFRASLEAASDVTVVERALADEEAKPLRPSALLEELVDCYRDDPSDLDGLDRTTGLPRTGEIPLMGMGEERFAELASPITYAPAMTACRPATFELADPTLADLLSKPDAPWSPSELESLINCPMRWLHERKLPSDELDIPFGDPRARGTFCHLVLERFHDLLGERTGIARITTNTPREVWEGVFTESFEYACARQPQEERPLIPVTELEKAQLRGIGRELLHCLEREQYMPEGFVPQASEFKFGQDGQAPVTFGGVRIRGSIDRLDVNPENNAVLVVDYKGGLQKGHGPVLPKKNEAAEGLDPLPRHSQILMYMAAVQQLMPEKPLAGGLYVSYKKPVCAGFLNPELVGLISDDRGAYLQRKNCVPLPAADGTPGIEVAIARANEAARETIDELREGRVVARPRFGKESCSYCPLAGSCPKEEK